MTAAEQVKTEVGRFWNLFASKSGEDPEGRLHIIPEHLWDAAQG